MKVETKEQLDCGCDFFHMKQEWIHYWNKRESYLFRLEGLTIQSGDFDCWKTNDFIRENNQKRVQANKEKVFYLPEFLHTET